MLYITCFLYEYFLYAIYYVFFIWIFPLCYILRVFHINIFFMLYITCFYMNISCMLYTTCFSYEYFLYAIYCVFFIWIFPLCYILRVFYMNISFMLIYVVHLTYLTYYCFLMKYDNKYFHPFSNMSFIYTGSTVSLTTGFLQSLLHIIHVSLTFLFLPVYQKNQKWEKREHTEIYNS
jgi:hypothetical protein